MTGKVLLHCHSSLEHFISKKLVDTSLPTMGTSLRKTNFLRDTIRTFFSQGVYTTTDSCQQEAHLLKLLFNRAIASKEILLNTNAIVRRLQRLYNGLEMLQTCDLFSQ